MAMAADEWSTTRARIPGLASLRGRSLPGHVIATNELTGELLFEVDAALSPAGREGHRFRRLAVYAFEFEARPDGRAPSRR